MFSEQQRKQIRDAIGAKRAQRDLELAQRQARHGYKDEALQMLVPHVADGYLSAIEAAGVLGATEREVIAAADGLRAARSAHG
jgi:hypothetical protein